MFITLEGGEGAGKSTQAALLAQKLRTAGYTVRLTREPGGTPVANVIRALLLHPNASLQALTAANLASADEATDPLLPITELLLLSAARAQHVARLREWLAAGEIVVCDRYADATRAYQGAARGLDAGVIAAAEQMATGGLVPDLTLLFDLPVEEGQRRRQQAHHSGQEWNRLDAETFEFHERVRQGYLTLASADPHRWVVLDAAQSAENLAERVWEAVRERLPPL